MLKFQTIVIELLNSSFNFVSFSYYRYIYVYFFPVSRSSHHYKMSLSLVTLFALMPVPSDVDIAISAFIAYYTVNSLLSFLLELTMSLNLIFAFYSQ